MTMSPIAEPDLDLESIKQFRKVLRPERIDDLIAAVEALRKRVAQLESLLPLRGQYVSMLANNAEQNARAEAAQARETELAGALEALYGSSTNETRERVRTTLAAMPAAALERAKARDEALDRLSDFAPWGGTDFAAFTKWVQKTARDARDWPAQEDGK